MKIYAIISLLSLMGSQIHYYFQGQNLLDIPGRKAFSTSELVLKDNVEGCKHETWKNMNAINRIANMILSTEIEIFQIDSILVGIAIIYLKSTQDIFQGINKLDHLLKVSIFQKYKNKKLEN